MSQLVYRRNFENATVFLSSTILNCSQSAYTCSALHVTDDSCMEDVYSTVNGSNFYGFQFQEIKYMTPKGQKHY